AEFHPMHAHWHDAAANRYAVYRYDLAAQERGALVNEGRKAGVCFADIGLVDLGLPFTSTGRFSGTPCLNPAFSGEWVMGLSPNWYDNYYWILADQYVEMTGAPDGAYALCSTTNQDHILLESDYGNNQACTLFELAGNTVTVLSSEPFHRTPPGSWHP
ncbi:MAG TPA: lysyl oxidase family protein, partial [Candidatus Thermoplasmatota archaeon]|nr:lysyl oxidase family protein [Candidatus Thermoplasmatota archaeon]